MLESRGAKESAESEMKCLTPFHPSLLSRTKRGGSRPTVRCSHNRRVALKRPEEEIVVERKCRGVGVRRSGAQWEGSGGLQSLNGPLK